MFFLSVVVCSMLAVAAATDVQQCAGKSYDLKNHVQLSPCKKSPCRLKKGTNQHITISFTPESDLDEPTNHVTATIAGVELPFVGVDGVGICDKLENEAGEKASCPLKAGTTYVYKDSFPILSFYPSIEVKVHWALQHKNKDIICFEVPAKIV
ncbi:ecdysteroid-regulated 16 kDa protein-like [Maniola jurtina]|uniref:ecdysteroid-regulated 16 kDa protein-like n=1 Tax=Maniola jurtina TaxID=191418 RepID=UPI001E68F5AA|nr:ecdysteroid-regulated 16 kDa protein-like [Maniola jurtina]